MSEWLMKVIKAEAERLIELAAEDDELRADLRELAESILAATELPQPLFDSSSSESPTEATPAEMSQTEEPLKELTLGRPLLSQSRSQPVMPARNPPKTKHDDLIQLERGCRRKCEAARWSLFGKPYLRVKRGEVRSRGYQRRGRPL